MSFQRILTIQDISCVGQCSMAVALPILSACGHETCVLPAGVLSTHTGGFGKPAVWDLTEFFPRARHHWLQAGIQFDVIYTGYLGTVQAIEQAAQMMDELLSPGGRVIVDPAMADHGKLYSGLDEHYAEAMRTLCMRADVMLPNVTEAAMMAGIPIREDAGEKEIDAVLQRLGGKNVVLTGISPSPEQTGIAVRTAAGVQTYLHRRVERSFHGTGDIFAASFTGAWCCGKEIFRAARIAADYTCLAIENTVRDSSHWYGVRFEPALPALIQMLRNN